ncbi:MAG: AI-2E family transporter [Lautropia sp.]
MITEQSPVRWLSVAGALGTLALTLFLLDWLEPVLVPLALALLFSFILSGAVRWLERRGIRRSIGATVLALVVVTSVGGLGWIVVRQTNAIVEDFPLYESRIVERLSVLRADNGRLIERLRDIGRRLEPAATVSIESRPPRGGAPREPAIGRDQATEREQTIGREPGPAAAPATAAAPAAPLSPSAPDQPVKVEVVADSSVATFSLTMALLQSIAVPIGTAGLALVLTIFMLIHREELRDRLIAVLSRRRLTLTTRALDDIGQRIARHLARQFLINVAFGLVFWLGMVWVGVPYAALWGVLAALLRYVPLIGPWIALAFPLLMSLLLLDGWTGPTLLVGWFVIIEIVFGAVLEPSVFGRGVGISSTATLIAIAFWSWLWGPIGLLLATPLTACVVVVAQFVPSLQFVATLLGDRPGLPPPMRLYQRLLARDEVEAADLLRATLHEQGFVETVDRTLVPAMTLASAEDAALLPGEAEAIWQGFDDAVTALERQSLPGAPGSPPRKLIAVAAPGAENELAVRLLRHHLGPGQVDATAGSVLLSNPTAVQIAEAAPDAVFIACLPSTPLARIRLLTRRLQEHAPHSPVLIGRWGDEDNNGAPPPADEVGYRSTSLRDTLNYLRQLGFATPMLRPAAGTQPGAAAGPMAGAAAGTSAGTAAGTSAGTAAGTSAGTAAGTSAGTAPGTAADAATLAGTAAGASTVAGATAATAATQSKPSSG